MKEIKLKIEIDDISINGVVNCDEFDNIVKHIGINPLLLMINKMLDELSKHENLSVDVLKYRIGFIYEKG